MVGELCFGSLITGKLFTEKCGFVIPKLKVERARSIEQFNISFNYKHLTTAN